VDEEELYGDELDEQPENEPILGPTDPEDPDEGEPDEVVAMGRSWTKDELRWQDDGGEA